MSEDASRPNTVGQPSNPGAGPRTPRMPHPSSALQSHIASQSEAGPAKKKKHRGGRKKRDRRQSFLAPSESTLTAPEDEGERRPSILDGPRQSASLYRLQSDNRSNTSLESEALLDHRDHLPFRSRRKSNSKDMFAGRASVTQMRSARKSVSQTPGGQQSPSQSRLNQVLNSRIQEDSDDERDIDATGNDRTPLLGMSQKNISQTNRPSTSRSGTDRAVNYGSSYYDVHRDSGTSPDARKKNFKPYQDEEDDDFDVNNPPSMPGSPKLGSLDDVMIAEEFDRQHREELQDAIIDIDRDGDGASFDHPSPGSPRRGHPAEMDVCFPGHGELSDLDEYQRRDERRSPRRRRRRQWPDLAVLDEWSREEKMERDAEQVRSKKMTEPVMVGGRLRNAKQNWHRQEDDAPYRYTYFNENFDATIHSRTISELCQFGATFRDLFRPEPPELSDSSSDEDESGTVVSPARDPTAPSLETTRTRSSLAVSAKGEKSHSLDRSGAATPVKGFSHAQSYKPKRFGPRPTFWLDVLSPTETEMKILAKAFGIHQLTVEDILVQEPREKVELFQNYYFVNYRSFEQDKDSEDYMEPINIYVVVFQDGVLSFHFSMTPHPANVRRRIRQLNDYMSPSADWVSYAIIDDVTDAYAPLVQQVEDEVDDIDDNILALHSIPAKEDNKKDSKSVFSFSEKKDADAKSVKEYDPDEGRQMLRRIGECRKKVMSLYRLLGNKADVIKGFAKRCNEQWQVAPRSEIGLYLGDIQDHIVTMTGNLSHYENLLSRAHSNYLAQINIRTSERAEQTNDVLNKLTVLGTIVLPMNVITGIWGMNCWVPGQDREHDLTWFWGITSGLLGFGLMCYLLAKALFGIV